MTQLKTLLQSKSFLLLSFIFLLSYVFLTTKVISYKSLYDINTSNLEGIIKNYRIDGNKLNVELKAKENIIATFYFTSLEEKEYYEKELKLGIKIKLEGELVEPSNNTIPNTFNYKKYLYNKKMYWTFNISKIKIKTSKVTLIYKVKNYLYKKASKIKNTNSYIYAFILGDKDYIENEVYNTFKNNGITHLFAVSGMHVGVLVGSCSYMLKKLHFKEVLINGLIIVFLIFYMLLLNFTASVVRASLMYIFLLINKKLKLNLNTKKILYLLCFILLIINPFYIYDIGFIYSFTTSLGLIIFNKKITGNYLKKLLMVSLIAFLFSLPITLYNNYEFNLLTVFNNIIIVPLVSIILFPLSLITFFFPIFNSILTLGFNFLEFISNLFNSLAINIVVPKINLIFFLIYYLIIYFIYKYSFKNIVFIVLLIITYKLIPFLDNNAYIYYLDVGQGDATLIVSENFKDKILIDTGGKISYKEEDWQKKNKSFNLADNIILFLKSLGITKLDLTIITHGDMDHLGYAKDILKNIKTKKIMFNNNTYNNEEKNLQKLSKEIKNNYLGSKISIYNLNHSIYDNENDSSLVLNVFLKNKSFLFMGDAPKKVEQEIISKYNLNSYILKVGHHGSNTSSDQEFLKEIKPKYAIVSAGRNNRYNHPSKETTDSLQSLEIPYFSTQDRGTIKFILTNKEEKICFYPP
ncbi:MAG: DNA internalization-related competence protein ComEC/Rec2 [Ruminococcus sp.]|nr:DNA internalization-related competence protein ComEC/Rec2 [Ruminococcus sp.]